MYLVAHYAHEDPKQPGSHYVYEGPVREIEDETKSLAYDWGPVFVQWYARTADSEPHFYLIETCGTKPPLDTRRPAPDLPMVTECSVTFTEPSRAFVMAYYLHPDPQKRHKRFVYRSSTIEPDLTEPEITLDLAGPVAVEWYYRQLGQLVRAPGGGWVLAKICGEIPVSSRPMMASPLDDPPLIARR
jgi:hypothetical protein